MFPTLETPRLLLTEIIDSDVNAIFKIFSNESVIKYYDVEVFEHIEDAQDTVALFKSRYDAFVGIRWGIRDKKTNTLIGTCGFNSWVISMRNAVIGYEIHPSYWRRGFAKEALSAILKAGFDGALPCGPIHRVQADTVPGNDASEKLLLTLGFQHEGLRRQCGYWKNQFHDLNCYGLLAHEFNIT